VDQPPFSKPNGGTLPFVTAGQSAATVLQKLLFGRITVVDDEVTEGNEYA
jgi:hypothetical protein